MKATSPIFDGEKSNNMQCVDNYIFAYSLSNVFYNEFEFKEKPTELDIYYLLYRLLEVKIITTSSLYGNTAHFKDSNKAEIYYNSSFTLSWARTNAKMVREQQPLKNGIEDLHISWFDRKAIFHRKVRLSVIEPIRLVDLYISLLGTDSFSEANVDRAIRYEFEPTF